VKLLLTGGHLTPALATIDYILQHQPDWQLVFMGREYSQTQAKQKSREVVEIKNRQLEFISFDSPRFTILQWWNILVRIPRLGVATIRAFGILIRQRPNVVLSFGGYLAVPITLAAWILRIPVITHEQTSSAGLANRIIARWAKFVAVSYPTSIPGFPKEKVVLTGNPLRLSLLQKRPTKPDWVSTSQSTKPVLYITGGNQGSEIINSVVSQAIPQISRKWLVIHQCGAATTSANYKATLERIKKKLPPASQKNYLIREWIDEAELAWIYAQAQCVVSRAGANTTLELETLQIPAILIPLPFSHASEQLHNAQALVKLKLATLIEQKDFNTETLLKALTTYQNKSRKRRHSISEAEIVAPAKQLTQLIRRAGNL
jgi:UDP-N-acetylglucosamine--N-acetylmuramyl-(pentapeptide) pyrophosphoryl-undecaprenol N-acetylglucosamine transferase